MPQSGASKFGQLLTISQASKLLGVSKTTLRCWSNEGKLKTFITPGGHRRYAEVELSSLLRGQQPFPRVKDLVAAIQRTPAKQRELARQHLYSMEWYQKLDEPSRRQLGKRGRELLDLVSQYVVKPFPEAEKLHAAHLLGQGLGMDLARMGLPLTDALEAFVLHRTPVLNGALELLKTTQSPNKRILAAIAQINGLLDQVLLSLVRVHQEYSSQPLSANPEREKS